MRWGYGAPERRARKLTRYLDLLDGAAQQHCPRFDAFWIVTNGKFSDRAATYGTCKRMPLIGWSFPTHHRPCEHD